MSNLGKTNSTKNLLRTKEMKCAQELKIGAVQNRGTVKGVRMRILSSPTSSPLLKKVGSRRTTKKGGELESEKVTKRTKNVIPQNIPKGEGRRNGSPTQRDAHHHCQIALDNWENCWERNPGS